MVRDREAERVRELERQREREQKWASGHDEGNVGGGSFMRRGGLRRGQGRLFFFNFATNDLGTTVAVAAALSLAAIALWTMQRFSLVAYSSNIKTGTCKIMAKEMQHISIPMQGVNFWRGALNVSLLQQENSKPQKLGLPPGAPTTCWSDGVAHDCEVPEAPAPAPLLATAYTTLKGTYGTSRKEEEVFLEEHTVGHTYACYFGYFPTDATDLPVLQVVLSVTKALHRGKTSATRGRLPPAPALIAAQVCVSIAAGGSCLLVLLKLARGQWRDYSGGPPAQPRLHLPLGGGAAEGRGGKEMSWRSAGQALAYSTSATYLQLKDRE